MPMGLKVELSDQLMETLNQTRYWIFPDRTRGLITTLPRTLLLDLQNLLEQDAKEIFGYYLKSKLSANIAEKILSSSGDKAGLLFVQELPLYKAIKKAFINNQAEELRVLGARLKVTTNNLISRNSINSIKGIEEAFKTLTKTLSDIKESLESKFGGSINLED